MKYDLDHAATVPDRQPLTHASPLTALPPYGMNGVRGWAISSGGALMSVYMPSERAWRRCRPERTMVHAAAAATPRPERAMWLRRPESPA